MWRWARDIREGQRAVAVSVSHLIRKVEAMSARVDKLVAQITQLRSTEQSVEAAVNAQNKLIADLRAAHNNEDDAKVDQAITDLTDLNSKLATAITANTSPANAMPEGGAPQAGGTGGPNQPVEPNPQPGNQPPQSPNEPQP